MAEAGGAREQAREIVERCLRDHRETPGYGTACEVCVAGALAAAQQETEKLTRLLATMTPTEAYDAIYRGLQDTEAQVRQLEQALNEESYAQCACTQEYEDMRAELERLRAQVRAATQRVEELERSALRGPAGAESNRQRPTVGGLE